MPRLYQVRDTLTEVLGMHEMTAGRHVNKLRDAGLLPSNTSASVDADVAARLLLGMLASRSPSETVNATRAFEALELLVVERREQIDDGKLLVTEAQIGCAEDVPVDVGGAEWFLLSEALPLALETGKATEIALRRNMDLPIAIIATAIEETGQSVRLLYGSRTRPAGILAGMMAIVSGKVDIWACLSGDGVQQISALLAGRPPVVATESQSAVIH